MYRYVRFLGYICRHVPIVHYFLTTRQDKRLLVNLAVKNGIVLTPSDQAIDVTPSQDGGILKDIHRPGYGHAYPGDGDVLYTHYHGQLINGSRFDASRVRNIMFIFTLGVG